jgi:hypothetical protein
MKELKNLETSNNNRLLLILPINKLEDIHLNQCAYSISEQKTNVDVLVLTTLEGDKLEALNSILSEPKVSVTTKDENGESKTDIKVAEKKINYVIEKTNSVTFAQMFNEAFNYSVVNKYKYFSVIEPDDVLRPNWFSYVETYSEAKPDFDGYMPINREISRGNMVGHFNEAVWFEGMAEVAGTFDLQLLLKFNCANVTGSVFKTESIKSYSEEQDSLFKPMKENIKISAIHEFFLRMVYNDLKFYTIPRVGYERRIDEPCDFVDAFSSKIPRDILQKETDKGGMTVGEYKFWSEISKKEYFFDNARNVSFTKGEAS